MNLVLDFGNTRVKAGLFKADKLVERFVFENGQDLLASPLKNMSIDQCLIASVTSAHDEVFEQLSLKLPVKLFTASTKVPLENLYKSAMTLGSDRLAAAVGSYHFYPSQNVLTIDAGTCIKYNFVNSHNQYLGGAISPGLAMRLKAMHEYTDRLPLVKADVSYHKLVGQNTNESILSGAQVAAAAEIDGMINRYLDDYGNLQVVLTGGDSLYLADQLKNRFFADQNILLYGLNTILNYQIEK